MCLVLGRTDVAVVVVITQAVMIIVATFIMMRVVSGHGNALSEGQAASDAHLFDPSLLAGRGMLATITKAVAGAMVAGVGVCVWGGGGYDHKAGLWGGGGCGP